MVPSRTTLTKYSQIFFDLDRTLWDFDRNSGEALTELFFRHNLDTSIKDPEDFINVYHEVNLELWDLYRKGEMTKDILRVKRFKMSFEHFGIRDDALAANFGDEYLEISPTKTILVPHTMEILNYLSGRYELHIITNGFLVTQQIKLKNCGLEKFFSSLTTSEVIGHNKPRPEIFHQALSSVHARKTESIMIGDD
ncbi:MAG: YjjG family noncanonical pyrimidine nucleotidase, partial [Bacteroidales bacterium]|nr:YjjG family noncanonical pyrimidine nucleotidase [Bacteroidales bacterium]